MVHIKNFILLLLVFTFIFISCTASGTVTDFNKKTIKVTSMKMDGTGALLIWNGNGFLNISLSKIKTIRIESDETKVFNKELFCLVEIIFKDGAVIGSLNDRGSKAYVAAGHYLFGKMQNSLYKIILSDVDKIEMVE